MAAAVLPLPDDIDALKALVSSMAAELSAAEARASAADALVVHLKQQIALLRRDKYGASAERSQRLADQLELRLEELEAAAAEHAVADATSVSSFTRRKPSRQPFPAYLPRERVVVPAPCACPACGGKRLSKLGEDVTETLEVVPRRWKVVQTVRERFACRDCEKISQPPAPFHVVPCG